jgi:hypothetical protein
MLSADVRDRTTGASEWSVKVDQVLRDDKAGEVSRSDVALFESDFTVIASDSLCCVCVA